MVLGGACLKLSSTTQAVRALSSGEAEYYSALKGASMALGFRSMAADLGEHLDIKIYTDSAAALGIIGRRGLGKIRRMETGYLRLQDLVADKKLAVAKAKGTENLADLGTRHLKAEDIDKHLSGLYSLAKLVGLWLFRGSTNKLNDFTNSPVGILRLV